MKAVHSFDMLGSSNNMASHIRKLESSVTPQWELQFSYKKVYPHTE